MLKLSESTQRIISLMKAENMNATQFAEAIGIQRAAMSHIMQGRNKPSADVLTKISERFDTINPGWLLSGRGSMRIMTDNAAYDNSEGCSSNMPYSDDKFGNTKEKNDMANKTAGIEPDLFSQYETKTVAETRPEANIRKEIRSTDKIFERNEVDESKIINKAAEKEVIIYKERPVKTIDKLLIFYNDNTFETFIPEKHSKE